MKNCLNVDVSEVNQDVGQLQVSVHDVHLRNGFEALDDLTQKVPGLLLSKSASEHSQSVQIPSVAVLHKQIEVVHSFLDVIQPDHVWMLDLAQDAYFVLQVLLQPGI